MPENRLASELSPYLRSHAHNPVDWYPWGSEALSAAQRFDKPILLSIGYSACHWCHVMERESFEDPSTAALMNEHFINIKVDREERPDLDQIYQIVVQLLGRGGGWPLTVFLTPDRRPFFGGTYFPPVEKYGMPSFQKVLRLVADSFRAQRKDIDEQAAEVTQAIVDTTKLEPEPEAPLSPTLLAEAARALLRRADKTHGGFGDRPKFPNTMSLEVLLSAGTLTNSHEALAHAEHTASRMQEGGIWDHLGGGFHRYSTDGAWLVPHFEKMLYDNALLLRFYTNAYRISRKSSFRDTALGIAEYVQRDMTDPSGGYYASEDADSEGEEGKFFVFGRDEVHSLLSTDAAARDVTVRVFGITDQGNFEHTGRTVLHEAMSVEAVAEELGLAVPIARSALARGRRALLERRGTRVRPFRDEKVLTSWTSLMASAMAEAGMVFERPSYVQSAERALAFVETKLSRRDGESISLFRHAMGGIAKGDAFLDDYAYLTNAALDLYEVTGKTHYVTLSQSVFRTLSESFSDPEQGGFFFTSMKAEPLLVRNKDLLDHAIPSGLSMAYLAMLRLGSLCDPLLLERAESELARFANKVRKAPSGMAQLVSVVDRAARGSVDVVIVGPTGDPRTHALHRAAFNEYVPHRTLLLVDPSVPNTSSFAPHLAQGKEAGALPVAYVCRGRTCSAPVSEPAALGELLASG